MLSLLTVLVFSSTLTLIVSCMVWAWHCGAMANRLLHGATILVYTCVRMHVYTACAAYWICMYGAESSTAHFQPNRTSRAQRRLNRTGVDACLTVTREPSQSCHFFLYVDVDVYKGHRDGSVMGICLALRSAIVLAPGRY